MPYLTAEEKLDETNMYKAFAQQVAAEYTYIYQATPEAALERVFQTQKFKDLFGNITATSTIKDLVDNSTTTTDSDSIIARKQKNYPKKKLFINIEAEMESEMDDFSKEPENSPKFLAWFTYNSISHGYNDTVLSYSRFLVKKFADGYEIEDWMSLIAQFDMIIYGWVIAFKLGDISDGRSYIEEGPTVENAKSWTKAAHLLFYYHLGKFDDTKKITAPRMSYIAKTYKFKESEVIRTNNELKAAEYRTGSHTNQISYRIKDYENILIVLKTVNEKAYLDALKAYKNIKGI